MKNKSKLLLFIGFIGGMVFTGCDKEEVKVDGEGGTNWTELGTSFDNQIYDVISGKDGKIYVSGGDIGNISVWDGTNWSRLGNVSESPFTGGIYWPITIDNNGNIFAVGFINVPMANSQYHIAKWVSSSNTWINLTDEGPLFDNGIHSLTIDNSGNLYVAGNVLHLSSVEEGNYIYKWNGSAWDALGDRLPSGGKICLHIDNAGDLYAFIGYNANFSPYVAKWNGIGWDELGGTNSCNFGTGSIMCINSDSKGDIYVGGYFTDGIKAYNIYKWTKTTNAWSAMYTYESSLDVYSIAFDIADTLYVAGNFVNTTNTRYIAKYHGEKWSDYGNLNANNTIYSICFDEIGNMYAGGTFTNKDNKYYVAVYKKR